MGNKKNKQYMKSKQDKKRPKSYIVAKPALASLILNDATLEQIAETLNISKRTASTYRNYYLEEEGESFEEEAKSIKDKHFEHSEELIKEVQKQMMAILKNPDDERNMIQASRVLLQTIDSKTNIMEKYGIIIPKNETEISFKNNNKMDLLATSAMRVISKMKLEENKK
ncbi:FixJ family two-component response regulator [Methanococcus voltae]|uniref:FixJ family two-component response regulator n=1 Tax=Methanococcus voltae TaxID=2188 RepID=A0A8J7S666_METVO|nr:hypothetical protein [Methanococcus voltae]MBP2202143.1 FixJ family two-component response regulator [Methanococcus voltae]